MPRDQPVKFLCAESTREMVRNTITPLCVKEVVQNSSFLRKAWSRSMFIHLFRECPVFKDKDGVATF